MTAHTELRLRILLTWAVEYVENCNTALEECHMNHDGTIDDEVAGEVADAKRWLAEAKEAL
jgi:hypothetical protein